MKDNFFAIRNKSLILLPHYDDELFISPLIRRLSKSNLETHVLWLTQSGGINKKQNGELIKKRKNESETFLRRIFQPEIMKHHLGILLGIEDGNLYSDIEKVERYLIDHFSTGDWNLITPHWENGHSDHDMSFLLGKKLELFGIGKHFSFPMYNTQSRIKPFKVLQLDNKLPKISVGVNNYDRVTFLLAPLFFPSQLKAWVGLYIPLVIRIFLRRHIFLFRGSNMEKIEFQNMRLIKRREKEGINLFIKSAKQYCSKNNILIS